MTPVSNSSSAPTFTQAASSEVSSLKRKRDERDEALFKLGPRLDQTEESDLKITQVASSILPASSIFNSGVGAPISNLQSGISDSGGLATCLLQARSIREIENIYEKHSVFLILEMF